MSEYVRSILQNNLRQNFPIRQSKERRDFSWRFLPYCMKPLPNGFIILLNRDYKPLGIKTEKTVNYCDPQFAYSWVEIGDINRSLMSDVKFAEPFFFFYNDESSPRYNNQKAQDYVERVLSVFAPMLREQGAK